MAYVLSTRDALRGAKGFFGRAVDSTPWGMIGVWQRFIASEAAGGIILMASAAAAIVVANSLASTHWRSLS